MTVKRFSNPMKIFITRLFTPHGTKEVQRTRTKLEPVRGEVRSIDSIEDDLIRVLIDAKASGMVVEVTQTPGYPLAMGHYHDHITIRESREVVKMIMARKNPDEK